MHCKESLLTHQANRIFAAVVNRVPLISYFSSINSQASVMGRFIPACQGNHLTNNVRVKAQCVCVRAGLKYIPDKISYDRLDLCQL